MRATPFARGRNVFALKTDNTDFIKKSAHRFWCQLANEVQLPREPTLRFCADRCMPVEMQGRKVKVSMESLILAQDERWRRA